MKQLIIAEKPSVAADIAKALGGFQRAAGGEYERDDAVISCAVGHLVEIEAPEAIARLTPVIPDVFELVPRRPKRGDGGKSTEAQLQHLVKLMRRPDIDVLVNACDAGREGELIFRLIVEYARSTKTIRRMWLQSMTPQAIREGHRSLRSDREMQPLATAARARAEADWIVGVNGSRFCSRLAGDRAPVGRVQTPTLMIVVAREDAIRSFVSRLYWEVHLTVQLAAGSFVAHWQNPDRNSQAGDPPERVWDQAEANAVAARCMGVPVSSITDATSPQRSAAPALFDLTTLQREANRLFGLSAKQTLDIAQILYEKHKVLTYPRTDAKALPEDYVPTITQTIEALALAGYRSEAAPVLEKGWIRPVKKIFDNSRISDHFAIVPTLTPASGLAGAERDIYDLVVRRLIAAFYPDAEYAVTVRTVTAGNDTFVARGRVLVAPGWMVVYRDDAGPADTKAAAAVSMPVMQPGEAGRNGGLEVVQAKTRAPVRYNEATLLSAMENAGRDVEEDAWREAMAGHGLGTPATRAATIEKLLSDGYLEREGRQLVPTARAFALRGLLVRIKAQALLSPALTGEWEAELKAVEAGRSAASGFRERIVSFVRELCVHADAIAPEVAGAQHACPACGKGLRRVKGPRGFFWGCTGYPACQQTLPDLDGAPGQRAPAPDVTPASAHPCPACGKPLRLRTGNKGAFWGCSGYPGCRQSVPDDGGRPALRDAGNATGAGAAGGQQAPAIGETCPACGKGTLQSRSLKGRPFVGCSAFPACRYFRWSAA